MALKKFAVNMVALTAARMFQTVTTFLAIPILARLLGPAEFGLVAIAGAFVAFTMTISDAGLGQTLVRVPRSERAVWSSTFWFIGGVGLILSLLLAAIAWPTAWVMQEPRLTAVILALAPLPLVQTALAPATADLQQREKFRHLAVAELVGSITGTLAAIALALANAGVWALVVQQLAYWAVKALVLTFSSNFRPDFTFNLSVLGPHLVFGRDTAILSIVGFFQRQLDPLVIGRFIGAASTGLYAVAGRIGTLPSQFLSAPLQNALFTRMVMLRNDRAASRDLFLVAAWIVAAIVFPGMAVASAAAEACFHVFLSAKWLPAAPVFALMAPAWAFQSVMLLAGTMMLAVGATGRRLRCNVEFMIAWLIALPIAALWFRSVEAVAAAYTLTYALTSIRNYPQYLEPCGCTVGDLFGALKWPILVSIGAAGAHLAVRTMIESAVVEVGAAAAIILIAYGVLALIEWRKIGGRIAVFRTVLSARGGLQEPEPA